MYECLQVQYTQMSGVFVNANLLRPLEEISFAVRLPVSQPRRKKSFVYDDKIKIAVAHNVNRL